MAINIRPAKCRTAGSKTGPGLQELGLDLHDLPAPVFTANTRRSKPLFVNDLRNIYSLLTKQTMAFALKTLSLRQTHP